MSDQPTIVLCPGQGAQTPGMGKAWFESSEPARHTFEQADAILDLPLSKICFEGPADQLNRTDIAQAAIYTTSVACYRALGEQAGTLVAAAGLSLGEFTALHLGGALRFEDGLRLVRLRGQAMQEAAQASDGGMVAITGQITEEQVNTLCDRARGDGVLVPANFNSAMQVVVSGSQDACQRAVQIAQEMGFKPTPLTVAGAFHSPLMQPAADRLHKALAQTSWQTPTVPVLSNVTALPHAQNDPASIQQRLVDQLTHPVRWSQSMLWAVENFQGRFIELAPGKVLSGLMRRIDRKTRILNFDTPEKSA